jgi:hypothetical protein
MAGERLAKLTLRVTSLMTTYTAGGFSVSFPLALRFQLAGTWYTFNAGLPYQATGTTYNFPNYQFTTTPADRAAELARAVDSLLFALRAACTAGNLNYGVSPKRASGAGFEFDIEATVYDRGLDLDFGVQGVPVGVPTSAIGSSVVANLTTIRPVLVAVAVVNALIYNSPTGSIALTASNGNDGVYSYSWADPASPTTASRSNVRNGSYSCTVADTSGASTTVLVTVGSDPRLDVLVNRTDNNVALVASGGLPPYTYLWNDGITTPIRLALAAGTYTCLVTDARGATVEVSVTIDLFRFYWSKNPVTLSLDAGPAYRLDPTTKPNLSFVCEVWVEDVYLSGVFGPVGTLQEQPADRNGRTVFDAQVLLDGYLRDHLPALNQAQPSRADCLFRRFYFKYAEKFGDPVPVAAPLLTQAQNYVVFGGLDDFEVAAGTWFSSYQPAVKPFLTWEPNDKAVLPSQPEYLYFMPLDYGLVSFNVQVRVQFANARSAQLVAATVTSVRPFEVYCLPVGYRALGLDVFGALAVAGSDAAPSDVVAWDVWVTDLQGVAHSEHRRYTLSTDYVARPRFFLYTNSLGGQSTFACTGYANKALDVSAEEADRPRAAGADPLLGDTLTTDRFGVPTLSVSSGKLSKEQLVTLQDFLLSKRVVLQAGGVYFPGKVKAKSVPLDDDAPGSLNALEFDFLLPKKRQFGPRLPLLPAGVDVSPVNGGEGAQP